MFRCRFTTDGVTANNPANLRVRQAKQPWWRCWSRGVAILSATANETQSYFRWRTDAIGPNSSPTAPNRLVEVAGKMWISIALFSLYHKEILVVNCIVMQNKSIVVGVPREITSWNVNTKRQYNTYHTTTIVTIGNYWPALHFISLINTYLG